jgi:hypothetical protein
MARINRPIKDLEIYLVDCVEKTTKNGGIYYSCKFIISNSNEKELESNILYQNFFDNPYGEKKIKDVLIASGLYQDMNGERRLLQDASLPKLKEINVKILSEYGIPDSILVDVDMVVSKSNPLEAYPDIVNIRGPK